MPQRRIHFVDVSPPAMILLAAGTATTGAVPQARIGAKVPAGAVVAGIEHTSTVAVTPLAGEIGQVVQIVDSRGRQREAVSVLVAKDAEAHPPPGERPADLGDIGHEDLPAWIDRLERAGVRADRHNSPDLLAQLVAAIDRPVDSIVCHALEADPTLPLQAQWALRHPLELREGLRLLARLTGARRTLLAVSDEDNRRLYRHLRRMSRSEAARSAPAVETEASEEATTPAATDVGDIEAGQSVIVPFEPAEAPAEEAPAPLHYRPPHGGKETAQPPAALGMRLVPVRNAYPQADPTLLIWALLSRRLGPGRLPTEAGAIVLDAVAATAIGSVARGASVIRREPLGVRDHRRDVSLLADTWRGSRASDVLRALGVIRGDDAVGLRGGDFLRERALPLDCVLDGGELVLHVTAADAVAAVPEPCIRCGWCLDICPTHVHPAGVLEGAQRADAAIAQRYGVGACIECGLCSYICPSRLPLLEAAQMMKQRA